MRQRSGVVTRLYGQIRERFEDGDALIEASKLHGSSQRRWLFEQLRTRGADDLVEEFRLSNNAAQVASTWEKKRRELARISKNIAEGIEGDGSPMSEGRKEYLSKRVEKLRKSIEKHEKGH